MKVRSLALAVTAGVLVAGGLVLPAHADPVASTSKPTVYSWDGSQTDSYTLTEAQAELTVLPAYGIRKGTQDFVAVRILAKAQDDQQRDRWLEVGYVVHGRFGERKAEIYTFNTDTMLWTWYLQYPLVQGQHIIVRLRWVGGGGWAADVNWENVWYRLSAAMGPGSQPAFIENFVERHADSDDAARVGGVERITAPAAAVVIRMDPGAVDTSRNAAYRSAERRAM